MPADVDPELLIDAILMRVADMNEVTAASGDTWLKAEFTRVMAAVMAGDVWVQALSEEGSSSQQQQNVNAKELLAILTQCRKRLPDANGLNGGGGMMLIPRLGDFPLN